MLYTKCSTNLSIMQHITYRKVNGIWFLMLSTSTSPGSQSEHLLEFSIASKGLFTSYSRVFPFNLKFESKKLINCLFCSIFELSNNL